LLSEARQVRRRLARTVALEDGAFYMTFANRSTSPEQPLVRERRATIPRADAKEVAGRDLAVKVEGAYLLVTSAAMPSPSNFMVLNRPIYVLAQEPKEAARDHLQCRASRLSL
jgi:hypothetical protein